MWVLDVKSAAWKPTRSIVGAIASTSGVVRPVALHRLWFPSRVVVSTMSTSRLTRPAPTLNSGVSYSIGSPFSTHTSTIVPATPACTAVIIFITSMMQTTVPGSTRAPTSTNGAAPGASAR